MTNFLSFPRLFSILLWLAGGLVILFLIAPIVAIVPLSFNAEPFFTYPMPGLSLRWYREFFDSNVWQLALKNSIIVAVFATLLSTFLGTLAAIGLSRPSCPARATLTAILISPMIVPVIVSAVGIYYAFAAVGLLNSLTGLVLAHTAIGAPFVVITVTATLASFDHNLMRAASSLGANPGRSDLAHHAAGHRAGGGVRRALCLRDVVRRSGDCTFHRRFRRTHAAAPDVERRARNAEPDDRRRRHAPHPVFNAVPRHDPMAAATCRTPKDCA